MMGSCLHCQSPGPRSSIRSEGSVESILVETSTSSLMAGCSKLYTKMTITVYKLI